MDDNTLTLEITCSLRTEIDDHQTHIDIKTIKAMDLMYFTPLLVLPTKAWISCILHLYWSCLPRHGSHVFYTFIGLAYQGKDIVFRFNIEYCGLMDFGP